MFKDVDAAGIDISLAMRPLAMVRGDPTMRLTPGRAERATWTPDGPAAIRVTWDTDSSSARVQTFGDTDTVIVGDSGIPSLVAGTLAGERYADDARMLELLEPNRPHRYWVLRLALAARSQRFRRR